MNKILLVNIKPFTFTQTVSIFEDGNEIRTIIVPMNKIEEEILILTKNDNISEVNIKLKVYPSIYNQYGNANEVIALCSSKDIILKPSEYYDFYLGQCFEIDTSTLLNETLIKDKSSNKVLFHGTLCFISHTFFLNISY